MKPRETTTVPWAEYEMYRVTVRQEALDRDGTPVPAGKIRQHVPGAPRQSGDRVLIVAVSDSTVDPGHIGKAGRVDYLNYDCGCGQKWPEEPMIGVVLDDGTEEEFWPEELATEIDERGHLCLTSKAQAVVVGEGAL